jgi:hypothetical protein
MESLLSDPLPTEAKATCSNCAMCDGQGEKQNKKLVFFDPHVKCCSYLPHLHNFLVGRVLLDEDPASAAGRTTVQERIRRRIAVTPLGLEPNRAFSLLYEHSYPAFGRAHALKCPHYLESTGGCGVWRNRESTCATWFCKHERGAEGQALWRRYLHCLLAAVETELSRWCLLQLRLGSAALGHILAPPLKDDHEAMESHELDGKEDPEEYRKNWGDWCGREEEFYMACAGLVSPLTWDQVLAVCGTEVHGLTSLLQEALRDYAAKPLPPRLKAGSFELVQISRETSRVVSYSEFDPIEVPNPVLGVLRYFDGKATSEVLEEIKQTEGIDLEADLVRKLADFRLLVPEE